MFAVIRAGLQQKKKEPFGVIGAEYMWRWLLLWNIASLVKQVWQQQHKTINNTAVNEPTLFRNSLSYLQSDDDQLPLQRLWSPHAAASTLRCVLSLAATPSAFCVCAQVPPTDGSAAWEKQAINKDDWHVCCGRFEKQSELCSTMHFLALWSHIPTYFTYFYLFRVDNKTP